MSKIKQGGLYAQPVKMKFDDISEGITLIKIGDQFSMVAKVPRMLLIVKVSSVAEGQSLVESLQKMVRYWLGLQLVPGAVDEYYNNGNLLNDMVQLYAYQHEQFFTEGAVEAHFWKD